MEVTVVHPFSERIRAHAAAIAPGLSRTAFQRGLAVTNKDGSSRAIPVTATPIVVSRKELDDAVGLSRELSSAAVKMAKAVLAGEDRELLLGALSPLERRYALQLGSTLDRLVTTRVDYFIAEKPWALEVNATIPAMQAYSDIAAASFIEAVGQHSGLTPQQTAELIRRNGSNTEALYHALLRGFALVKDGARPKRILLLCRRHDSQISEQLYLARRFTALGTEAHVVHPDELSGDTEVRARGMSFDLVYRHLFVRRLEETPSAYVEELFANPAAKNVVLFNPPASQVEVKATFALLSRAVSDGELAGSAGLTDDELKAISESVPWTRPFRNGRTVGPDGAWTDDLVELVAANPSEFVLKRSWDYGGKTVFVGSSVGEAGFVERVKATYGGELSWPELVRRAADDRRGGGFVVQKLVKAIAQNHLLCAEGGTVREAELYVDFSSYASVGLDERPHWGGVCRGSISRIVNILGGGGVLPLLTEEVADALEQALPK
jgi:hypothetical protein